MMLKLVKWFQRCQIVWGREGKGGLKFAISHYAYITACATMQAVMTKSM